jgi:hypothetical protein
MILTLKINIVNVFKTTATRNEGAAARQHLMNLLQIHNVLELDFLNAELSVSFADECLGMLAQELGKTIFNQRVHFKNTSAQTKALLLHVISRRLTIK